MTFTVSYRIIFTVKYCEMTVAYCNFTVIMPSHYCDLAVSCCRINVFNCEITVALYVLL